MSACAAQAAGEPSSPLTNAASSRSELFGAESTRSDAFAFSGFYELDIARTYASPVHWSRGVSRLQLAGQGAFSPEVKYKIGARIDADPVYAASNFYTSEVRRDQKLDVTWRENYIDFSAGEWDYRVGAQQIVWGEVVGLLFADVVSARDQRDFLLPSFDIIRIPQWAARVERSFGDAHLELVWIPIPVFDRIGKPGADFYPIPFPSPTPEEASALVQGPHRPDRNLRNSNYGLRANTIVEGWDIAGFLYRSFSTAPTFYRVDGGIGPPRFDARYDRLTQAGATVSKGFEDIVFRAEAVYTRGQNFPTTRFSTPQAVVERSTLDYILSADLTFAGESRLNLQAFQRVYDGGRDDIALNPGRFGASVLLSTKAALGLQPSIQWIQTFGGGGGLVRPRIGWQPYRNVSVAVGADIFTGPIEGFFGRYNNRDRLYTEMRLDF